MPGMKYANRTTPDLTLEPHFSISSDGGDVSTLASDQRPRELSTVRALLQIPFSGSIGSPHNLHNAYTASHPKTARLKPCPSTSLPDGAAAGFLIQSLFFAIQWVRRRAPISRAVQHVFPLTLYRDHPHRRPRSLSESLELPQMWLASTDSESAGGFVFGRNSNQQSLKI
jgi:hypothetical protein